MEGSPGPALCAKGSLAQIIQSHPGDSTTSLGDGIIPVYYCSHYKKTLSYIELKPLLV